MTLMCGIAGIWRYDQTAANARDVLAMLTAIVHRGPDDRGLWQEGRIALGQQRLTILDLSARANQPMLTPDGRGVLVYNGEVYNYQDLRRELEREGIAFRTTGDTEVVLQALHCWGPKRSIPLFDGMFAIAYFDLREEALWLARDRLGIKPLAVYQTDAELVFASEVKALLVHPAVPRRVDMTSVSTWLLGRPPVPPRTFFEGVGGLEAGTWWKVTGKGVEREHYFHVLKNLDIDRLRSARDGVPGQFVGAFRHTLKSSVRLHLASDVPIAAMCSGGVDSSLIAAYAKEYCPTIQTYVADVGGDESEWVQADRVAKHLGIGIHRVPVHRRHLLQLWPEAVWHSDGPIHRPSDPALLAVAKRCRADGIKVLLTGEGSDELFGGYGWQDETFRLWQRMHTPWRKLYQRWIRKSDLVRLRYGPFAGMLSRRDPRFRRRLVIAMEPELQGLPRRLMDHLHSIDPPEDRAFLAQCFNDLYDNMQTLLHRHDRMGMAASIEMRVPFLENEMFDLAFHLPRRAKLHKGRGKWVVKEAASLLLPADVVHAPKKGFPIPPDVTRGCEGLLLRGLVPALMGWSSASLDEVLALARDDAAFRFQVTGLEIWMRLFFGSETAGSIGERLQELAA
jgi:asparagine synthase (glutamine-hydrolysing)